MPSRYNTEGSPQQVANEKPLILPGRVPTMEGHTSIALMQSVIQSFIDAITKQDVLSIKSIVYSYSF